MNADSLHIGILLPAFVAGMLVLATHVPLGREVLRRGIVFIDLAIAQFAGLGIVIAHVLHAAHQSWHVQGAAFAAALAGALLLHWRERHYPAQQEAVIGVSFVVAACMAMLLLANDPEAGEHLRELLVGQILWSTWRELAPLAVVTAVLLAAWYGTRLGRSRLGFYMAFAIAVTSSVQVVGVYLVFATLIVPALAAGDRLGWAYGVGIAGYGAGLLVSAWLDLPSGAAIVLALVLAALAATALRRLRAAPA